MKEVDFVGKLRVTKDSIIIQRNYIEPEKEEILEKMNGDLLKVRLTDRMQKRTLRSYEQLKLWFSMVEDIILFNNEEINKETKLAIHEFLKEQYIPTEYIELNGKQYPLPKSIADIAEIPKEKFQNVLSKILEDFRKEGVIFRVDSNINFKGTTK